jgi:hypothetical protein
VVGATVWLPLAALLPLQSPPAEHEVGLFVTLQVIVALLPEVMLVGLTEMLMPGVAIAVSVTDPLPVPALLEQLSV